MPDKNPHQWLVITDLDGTLLNHHDYQWHAALPAIEALAGLHIPVIFNTSKTYPETLQMQRMLSMEAPFVVENGSCLYLPKQQFSLQAQAKASSRDNFWQVVLGKTFAEIETILNQLDTDKDAYIRLSDCTPEEVSHLTGLHELQAKNAIKREFSEPILWQGSAEELGIFQQQLQDHGLTTLQGGRFLHILGQCNKASAIEALSAYYDHPVKTIVLGDSSNDIAMLKQADIPIVVRSPGNMHLLEQMIPPYITKSAAPDGWTEGIMHALDKIKAEET